MAKSDRTLPQRQTGKSHIPGAYHMGREPASMIPTTRKRDLTGPLYLVNLIGAISAAVYIGLLLRGNASVMYALIAVCVYTLGLLAPFFAEYLNVSKGFDKVDQTFRDRHINPDQDVEVYSDSLETDPTWNKYYKVNIGAFAGAIIGSGLFAADIVINFVLDRA